MDEFLRRIFAVIHSNDPVARALTLRTLGLIASIVPEKKQIHHTIRNALDSHESVELAAAIFAAGKLYFKDYPDRRANPGSFWFSFIFSPYKEVP